MDIEPPIDMWGTVTPVFTEHPLTMLLRMLFTGPLLVPPTLLRVPVVLMLRVIHIPVGKMLHQHHVILHAPRHEESVWVDGEKGP